MTIPRAYFGNRENYYFISILSNDNPPFSFLERSSSLLSGLYVTITAFDSGIILPSIEEQKQGWKANFCSMASPKINPQIDIPFDCWDEWYFFAEQKLLYAHEIFVNKGIFCLHPPDQVFPVGDKTWCAMKRDELIEELKITQEKFWEQTLRNKPIGFMLSGDNFVFGSSDKNLFENAIKLLEEEVATELNH